MKAGFILLFVMIGNPAFADAIADLLQAHTVALVDCVSHLPASQSMAWQDSRGRGKFPAACKTAKRLRDDARDMENYRNDLLKLYDASPVRPATRDIARQEAEDISIRMVTTTRKLADEFRMIHSAVLNNVLVNIGAKEGGQCYQWVRGLLADLPAQPYQVFERTWGGAYLQRMMENNSVIFTIRGQDLKTGIVYDAWRAHGHPWWRKVSQDHYPWMVDFTEAQILAGEALVVGEAERRHPRPQKSD